MHLDEQIEHAREICSQAGLDTSVPVDFHEIPYYEVEPLVKVRKKK